MKQLGVLASTDGPLHNVIKLKPPLCMTIDDASCLVKALDQALCELEFYVFKNNSKESS